MRHAIPMTRLSAGIGNRSPLKSCCEIDQDAVCCMVTAAVGEYHLYMRNAIKRKSWGKEIHSLCHSPKPLGLLVRLWAPGSLNQRFSHNLLAYCRCLPFSQDQTKQMIILNFSSKHLSRNLEFPITWSCFQSTWFRNSSPPPPLFSDLMQSAGHSYSAVVPVFHLQHFSICKLPKH